MMPDTFQGLQPNKGTNHQKCVKLSFDVDFQEVFLLMEGYFRIRLQGYKQVSALVLTRNVNLQ